MKQFSTVDEVLDFAIAREIEAAKFYKELAETVNERGMAQVFEEFAAQEARHQARLKRVKDGRLCLKRGEDVPDLKIADYVVDMAPSADMDYQAALSLAMLREKAAFRMYIDLAAQIDDDDLRELFQVLAQEEAKHKLHLELEYDDHIFTDN